MKDDVCTSNYSLNYQKGIEWLENEVRFNEIKLRKKIDKIKSSTIDEQIKKRLVIPLEDKLNIKYNGFDILPIYILSKSGSDIIEDFLSVTSKQPFWDEISSYIYEHYHWLWYLGNLGLGENEFFIRELDELIRTQSVEGYFHSNEMDHTAPMRVLVLKYRGSKQLENAVSFWVNNWHRYTSISTISVGILSLTELDDKKYDSIIKNSIEYIKTKQKDDGHWQWAAEYPDSDFNYLETCYAIGSISRVNGPKDISVKNAINWIKNRQLKNGSWDNDVDNTTYSLLALLCTEEGIKIPLETLSYEKIKREQDLLRKKSLFLHTSPIFKENLHVRELYNKIYEMLHNAENEIRIISPYIDILYEEIINIIKNNENISIKIITRYKKDIKGFRERIAKNVIDLLSVATKGQIVQSDIVHSRLIIIDEEELLVSSADLTRDQLYDEYNSGIWTRDKDAIKKSIEYFDNLYKHYKIN